MVCLNCYSYAMDEDVDSEQLHKVHSEGEEEECFSCHVECTAYPFEERAAVPCEQYSFSGEMNPAAIWVSFGKKWNLLSSGLVTADN